MSQKSVYSDFYKKRLTFGEIKEYLQEQYHFGQNITQITNKRLTTPCFLQNNYGQDSDCTLTSILTVAKYYNRALDPQEVYNYTEKIAKTYLYNGSTYGTIPFTHRAIANKVFKHFDIGHRFTAKYLKKIGFTLWDILSLIDEGIPVILSLANDGKDYYKGHTVTVLGYAEFCDEYGNLMYFLQIYDNWDIAYSLLDYETLSTISAIYY